MTLVWILQEFWLLQDNCYTQANSSENWTVKHDQFYDCRCYIQVPEQFKCFTLINCGNKSKSFLSFISFIVVSQHRVQVSCTSSHSIKSYLIQLVLLTQAHYKLPSSFTNSFTAKAVPHMLSSVLTDALQMLPSAVNSHSKAKSIRTCL